MAKSPHNIYFYLKAKTSEGEDLGTVVLRPTIEAQVTVTLLEIWVCIFFILPIGLIHDSSQNPICCVAWSKHFYSAYWQEGAEHANQ